MATRSISVLKPNVNQEEALRAFSARGLSALYWRVRGGPLQRIADVYVPFSLFTVRYQMGKGVLKRLLAMDAVDGSLDLFQFPQIPTANDLVTIATRNTLPASLSESRGAELLRRKALRLIFQQGFFRVSDPQLKITREHFDVHVPYWLGFHGNGNGILRCRVLDAVRRRFEGAKASAFFEEWLAA